MCSGEVEPPRGSQAGVGTACVVVTPRAASTKRNASYTHAGQLRNVTLGGGVTSSYSDATKRAAPGPLAPNQPLVAGVQWGRD